MEVKLEVMHTLHSPLPEYQMQQIHYWWDTELGEILHSLKKGCGKIKSCAIEYSPTVGLWLQQRAIYKWILRWHAGKVPDTWNVLRAAKQANIDKPLQLSKQNSKEKRQGCLHVFDPKHNSYAGNI